MLSACSGLASNPSPTSVTPNKSAAQAASAVARTQDSLVSRLDWFSPELCMPVYQRRLKGDALEKTCDDASEDVRRLARTMKADLEAAQPWAKEVSDLAKSTVEDLERLAEATEDSSNGKASAIAASGATVRSDLKAWKPFGT